MRSKIIIRGKYSIHVQQIIKYNTFMELCFSEVYPNKGPSEISIIYSVNTDKQNSTGLSSTAQFPPGKTGIIRICK